MTDDHTFGEIVRRLDEVSRRLDEVSGRLEARHAQMEAAYVRKDVFDAVQQADGIQVRGIEAEVQNVHKRLDLTATETQVQKLDDRMTRTEDQRRTDRNLLLASLAFPLLLLLVGALITSGSLG